MADTTLSATVRLQTALSRQTYSHKCSEISAILRDTNVKEIHTILPLLVENIFGFGNHVGWNIGRITRSQSQDFNAIRSLLSPAGPLLQVVYKLMQDTYCRYEFPMSCIPFPSRRTMEEGGIPALYGNKLQFLPGQARPHSVLILNAFEYYFFHFSYFLVSPKMSQGEDMGANWSQPSEFLYPTLLEDYLDVILPADVRKLPPMPQSSMPVRSPIRSSANGNASRLQASLLKSASAHQKSGMNTQQIAEQAETETWRSQMFLQILVEFWLNQNTLETEKYNFHQPITESFLPTCDHLRVVRMLVKHLHYFTNSARPDVVLSPYSSPASFPYDEFKRLAISQIVQKRLYAYLKHSFERWPLDSSFRLVLETWLSYIQPWRYLDISLPPKSRHEQEQAEKKVEDKWKPFVAENLLFYATLFHEFLPRVFRTDASAAKNAFMIYRVSKVFNTTNLPEIIEEVESALYEPIHHVGHIQATTMDLGASYLSPSNRGSTLNAQFTELEGPSFQYQPLFSEHTISQIRDLLKMLSQAKITSQETLESTDRKSTSLLGWMFGPVKDMNTNMPPMGSMYDESADNCRIGIHLDSAANFLCHIFRIEPEREFGKVSWGSNETASTSDHSPDVMVTEDGASLSPLGRYQLMNGLRHFDIHYMGDPDLQPIRSFENAFLVRVLHKTSSYLNEKYADEIDAAYSRNDLMGRIACQFLHPPVPAQQCTSTRLTTMSPLAHHSLQRHNRPRINLRVLSDYRAVIYLVFFYVLLRLLFNVGPIRYFIVLFGLVFLYVFIKALMIPAEKLKNN